ncbi:thiamine diphosphokinase [Tropheryma whipplei]|uniref:thiamine diphosphokinase n=1 Tax=Tropheryma whipplei TaxID=2039 RepID=UPI0012BAD471|nr:thiamine diphosphokinase [Tropheryma whipplei]
MLGMGVCYIYGAGEHFTPPEEVGMHDLVIAADGGLMQLKKHGARIDLYVGDLDSIESIPINIDRVILPREKDKTDMMQAALIGAERGFRTFCIFGGTGGRLDHTIGNIQLLAELTNMGYSVFIVGKYDVVTAIRNNEIYFPSHFTGNISIFPHSGDASGVYEEGLKYALNNAHIPGTFNGVSNEFVGVKSRVAVESGMLLVVYERQGGRMHLNISTCAMTAGNQIQKPSG